MGIKLTTMSMSTLKITMIRTRLTVTIDHDNDNDICNDNKNDHSNFDIIENDNHLGNLMEYCEGAGGEGAGFGKSGG